MWCVWREGGGDRQHTNKQPDVCSMWGKASSGTSSGLGVDDDLLLLLVSNVAFSVPPKQLTWVRVTPPSCCCIPCLLPLGCRFCFCFDGQQVATAENWWQQLVYAASANEEGNIVDKLDFCSG